MPWNLLIFPLLGGYYILSRSNFFRFKQQRLDRQRLIFDTILFSIVVVCITFVLKYLVLIIHPNTVKYFYSFFSSFKVQYLGTTFSSFVISILLTEIGNKTIFKDRQKRIQSAIKSVGNELELLLMSSFKYSKLLEFTLDTDKVYIAWVKELPIPTITNYIRVIPVFSGYRDDEKGIVFTTHYLSVYAEYISEGKIQGVDELDVDLIITLDNVVSVSYFDTEMYERFQNPLEPEDNSNKPPDNKVG